MSDQRFRGKLISWNDERGFGFIEPDHADDENRVFIHITALRGTARRPVSGDIITYELTEDENGKPRAIRASIEGVSRQTPTRSTPKSSTRSTKKSSRNVIVAVVISFIVVVSLVAFLSYPSPITGCTIKGNISLNSGTKYYHLPGMRDYDKTKIDIKKGERWFCTEEDAISHGWKKAGT